MKGMSQARVQAALGHPRSKYKPKDPESQIETWIYERKIKGPPFSSSIISQLGHTTVTDFLRFIDTVTIEFKAGYLSSVLIKRRDDRTIIKPFGE